MDSFRKDYRKLYRLQDKFLEWWKTQGLPFYLTGGTALGRYYLNHRNSEDLDFFLNADPAYADYIDSIKRDLPVFFQVDKKKSLFTEDLTRFYIKEDDSFLKIEFINDVPFRKGDPLKFKYGLIDTPENILSNKLSALIGRDEPKDAFDIISLSLKYSFKWEEIFYDAKQKAALNEIDIEQKLYNFPVDLFDHVDWLYGSGDKNKLTVTVRKIADDFLLGADNSVCEMQIPIKDAKPHADI